MDWTKAKTILIIALIITNVIIGYSYSEKIKQAETQQIEQAMNTKMFLETKEIIVQVEIPTQALKRPVLFVRFEAPAEGMQAGPIYYQGVLVEASVYKENAIIPIAYGETKRDVSSASYALLKSISGFIETKDSPLVISDIRLIYLIANADYDQEIREDTAVPTWKISTESGNIFYVNDYGE